MSRKLLFLIIGAFVLVVLGGAAVTVLRKPAHPAEQKPAAVVKHYKSVALEDFIVNLADLDEQHYLKTTIVLDVEEKPEIEKEIEKLTPKIRDAMITTMSRNRFQALLTPQGKTALKASLKKAANSVLGDDVVHDVYFTSFAMQ